MLTWLQHLLRSMVRVHSARTRLPELISDCTRQLKTEHPARHPAIPPRVDEIGALAP